MNYLNLCANLYDVTVFSFEAGALTSTSLGTGALGALFATKK